MSFRNLLAAGVICLMVTVGLSARSEHSQSQCFITESAQFLKENLKHHGIPLSKNIDGSVYVRAFDDITLSDNGNNSCVMPELRLFENGDVSYLSVHAWCDFPLGPDIFTARRIEGEGLEPQNMTTFSYFEMILNANTGVCEIGSTPHVQVVTKEYIDEYVIPEDAFLSILQVIGAKMVEEAKDD